MVCLLLLRVALKRSSLSSFSFHRLRSFSSVLFYLQPCQLCLCHFSENDQPLPYYHFFSVLILTFLVSMCPEGMSEKLPQTGYKQIFWRIWLLFSCLRPLYLALVTRHLFYSSEVDQLYIKNLNLSYNF